MEYLDLVKAIAEIKGKLDVQDNRFKSGADSFQNLRLDNENLRKEIKEGAVKPLTKMQLVGLILGPILGIALIFYQVIWQASRYPDRNEFIKLDDKIRSMEVIQIGLERDVRELNGKLVTVQRQMDRLLDKGSP